MRLLSRVVMGLLIVFLTIFLSLFIVNCLPFPFNRVNAVFFITLITILFNPQKNSSIWLAFISLFLINLMSIAPFSVIAAATICSLMAAQWLVINALTGRSLYTALLSSLIILIIYNIIYIFLFNIYDVLYKSEKFSIAGIIPNILWEIILTSLFVAAAYGCMARWRKKDASYLQAYKQNF